MKAWWPDSQTKTLATMTPEEPSESQESALRACFEARKFEVDDLDPALWHVEGRQGDIYDVHVIYMPNGAPSVTCTCQHGRHHGGKVWCWHSLLVLRILRAAARKKSGLIEEKDVESRVIEDVLVNRANPIDGSKRSDEEVGYRLFTSNYKKFTPDMGVPVKISNGRPKFALSYDLRLQAPLLYPDWAWMKWPVAKFREAYWKRLDGFGLYAIEDLFRDIVAENARITGIPDDRLVLMCFEQKTKDCHRGDFAMWYEKVTGELIPELPEGVASA